ncbi:hypothetical protein CPB84DRAFT_1843472 [Gymnopilus junonius]|uniref:Uncharacterized protein n=1 Tax=Gymnopilus junonius TaxID=109634 RepID=A0A9P5NTZ7_GYMJU|nr:hypothetical protein CPB84DRAFT_1843472 [Gymnopilus junonius]
MSILSRVLGPYAPVPSQAQARPLASHLTESSALVYPSPQPNLPKDFKPSRTNNVTD